MQSKTKAKIKSTIIGLLLVALIAALAIAGTMAYLKDEQEVTNTFTVGDLELSLTEPDYPEPAPKDLAPGDCFPKNPTVAALKGDGYMRVTVEMIDLATNLRITDEARLALIWGTVFYAKDYDSTLPGSEALPLDRDGRDVPKELQKTGLKLLLAAGINRIVKKLLN